MKPITQQEITDYVAANIQNFHQRRLDNLQKLRLMDVIKRKNPYLFKAKNINTAQDFVKTILDAFLSSQEEGIFGGFLEELAIFICSEVYGGQKSSAEGIDLEFEKDSIRYIVDLRINETLQTGAVRKPHLPFCRLVGTVSNCADAVQLGNRTYRGAQVSIYF